MSTCRMEDGAVVKTENATKSWQDLAHETKQTQRRILRLLEQFTAARGLEAVHGIEFLPLGSFVEVSACTCPDCTIPLVTALKTT